MDPKSVLLGLREKSLGLSFAQTRIPRREIIICGLVMEFTVELINEYDVVWDACFAFETTGMILKKYMELDMADMETEEIYAKYNMANAKEIRFHHLSGWLSKKISGFVQDHQSIIRDSFLQTATASRRSG